MIYTQESKVVVLTEPAALVDNAAVVVNSCDTRGWEYADFYVLYGATDAAATVQKLTEADDNATWSDVPGSDYSNAANGVTLPTAASDNTVHAFHVNLAANRKRFLKPAITIGAGVANGAYVVVIAVLSRPHESPSTAAGRGLTQEVFV